MPTRGHVLLNGVAMSLIVLGIAAAHALPPIIGGVITNGKGGVMIGAIVGATIAVLSGNPAFMISDLIGVAAGTWLGFTFTR
jgi:hypothetical protein